MDRTKGSNKIKNYFLPLVTFIAKIIEMLIGGIPPSPETGQEASTPYAAGLLRPRRRTVVYSEISSLYP